MMGSENEGGAHPLSQPEKMETLILDDPLSNSKSYSNYESVMTTLSESSNNNHPLLMSSTVAEPVDSDPLMVSDDRVSSKDKFSSHCEDSDFSDVFVSPTVGGVSGGVSNGIGNHKVSVSRSESLSSLGSDYLNIVVSNPHKEHEISSNSIVPGGNTYVSYSITTKTNMRGCGSDFSVRRRFKDVVTLAERLSESYRGFFIPPRPEKSVVESQVMHMQEFVEQRRVALEKYLRKLAAHPVIRTSDELRVFLQVPGKLPLSGSTNVASRMLDGAAKLPKQLFGDSRSVVAPHEVAQPANGGRDLLRLFRELRQSVTNEWGNLKPALVEEDKEFLEKKEIMYDFEHRHMDVSKQVILHSQLYSLVTWCKIADIMFAVVYWELMVHCGS